MSDDSPWTDDRDRQASLFGDTDATRTMDRSGETVTGSDSFADDRDTGGVDPGEQAGLFEQTEELEGQAALGGGTATQTESEGFFGQDGGLTDVDQSRPFAFDDYGPTSRRPVPDAEQQEVSRLGGVDRRRLQGTALSVSDAEPAIDQPGATNSPGQFLPPDEEPDPPENVPEQLAAQRAAPTLTRPSATPAVELFDVGETESPAEDRNIGGNGGDPAFPAAVGVYKKDRQSGDGNIAQVVYQSDRDEDRQLAYQKYADGTATVDAWWGSKAVTIAEGSPDEARAALIEELSDRREATEARSSGSGLADRGGSQTFSPLMQPSATPAVELFDVDETGRSTGDSAAAGSSGGLLPAPEPTPDETVELDFGTPKQAKDVRYTLRRGELAEADDWSSTTVMLNKTAMSEQQINELATRADAADSSPPGELVGRTDRGTEERIDVRQGGGQFYPQRIERDPETGEILDQETLDAGTRSREGALETARREFAEQVDQDDDGTPDTAEVRLELPDSRAAEAGQLVARMGERGILDVGDQSALGDVRAELQRIEDGDEAFNLSDDQARAFGEAIEQVGSDLPASQQPQGFELLPDSDELVEEPSGTPGSDGDSPSSGGRIEQFDFGSREFANETRDELPDDAMTGRFDRRNKTVEVDVSKLSDSERQRLESAAARSFADEEAESPGLTELSESERESLSGQSASWSWQKYGFQAMRAKSALRSRGVKGTEWLDYYEPGESWRSSVEKLDDARERAARGGGATGIDGERKDSMDERLTRGGIARNIEQRRGDLKEFALRGAREGDEEAISVLVNEFDVPEERARGFVDDTESEQERVAMMETVVARVEANGRFTTPPPQDAPRSPGKRGRSSGQYIGDEVITPADPGAPIRRDPETGQFFVAEGERGNGGPPSGPVTETQVQRGDLR